MICDILTRIQKEMGRPSDVLNMGNNPMVGATVAVAVAVEEAAKAGKF